MKNKKMFIYTSLIICYALTIIGGTYAYLQLTATKNNITAQVGCFDVNYQGEEIKHTNLSATTNYLEGARSNVTLSKDANCKIYNEAYIYIHVNNNITAPIETVQALKYKVVQGNNNISEGLITQKGDNLLATVPLTTTSTTYTIYIWVDASLSNKQYDEVDFTGYIFAESDQTSTVENNYTVTFNPNGGSVSPTTKSVSFRKPYGSLPTPTKSGSTFKGWSLLPTTYKQLDYLESTGTQYILTDVFPTSNFKLVADIYVSSLYNGELAFAGAASSGNNNGIEYYILNGHPRLWCKENGSTSSLYVNTNTAYDQIIHYEASNSPNGRKIETNVFGNKTDSFVYSGESTIPLTIFAYNYGGSRNFFFKGRIYNIAMYNNDSLLSDFTPCYNTSTSKAGLCDIANNNTFYGNNGTGNFTYGQYTYINNGTLVDQNKNHTLYAIWE